MHENRIDGFREQRTEYRIADQKEKSGYCSTAKKNADIFLILFYPEKKGGQKNAQTALSLSGVYKLKSEAACGSPPCFTVMIHPL